MKTPKSAPPILDVPRATDPKPARRFKRLDRDMAPLWEPLPNAVLEGTLDRRHTAQGNNGDYTVYTVVADKGELACTGFALDEAFRTLPDGAYVRITFVGTKKTGNGFNVKKYEIEVDPDSIPAPADPPAKSAPNTDDIPF